MTYKRILPFSDVESINGQTGVVTLDATAVSALSNTVATSDKEQFKLLLADLASTGGKVVWVGDSITEQGNGLVGNGIGFTTLIENQFPGAVYVNAGTGGYTSLDVYNNLATYQAHSGNLYVVAVGVNDIRYNDVRGATTQAGYLTNITNIITGLSAGGATVVLISIWPTFWEDQFAAQYRFTTDQKIIEWNKALSDLAKDQNCLFLDSQTLISSAINLHNVQTLIPDGVHPDQNATIGKMLYADAVLNDLIVKGKYTSEYVPTGTYFFKLVIHYHGQAAAGGYCGLQNIEVTATDSFSCTANLSFTTITNLFGSYNAAFAGYYNKANDWPLYLTFSTATMPTSAAITGIVSGTGINRGARSFDLYMSKIPEALSDLNHPSWELINSERSNDGVTTNLLPSKRGGIYYQLSVSTLGGGQTTLNMKKIAGTLPVRVWTQNILTTSAQRLPLIFTSGATLAADGLNGNVPNYIIAWEAEEELSSVALESFSAGLGDWVLKKSYQSAALSTSNHSSWKVVASGTGDQTVKLFLASDLICSGKVITGDQTTTLDTAVDVNDMKFYVGANEKWIFEFSMMNACDNTGGLKYGIVVPSGSFFAQQIGMTTSTSTILSSRFSTSGVLSTTAYNTANSTAGWTKIYGTVENGATAGVVKLQFASGVAGQTSTIYKYSTMWARRIV